MTWSAPEGSHQVHLRGVAHAGDVRAGRRGDPHGERGSVDDYRFVGEGLLCSGHGPTSRDGMPGWTPRKGPPRGPATGRRRLNGTIPATRPTRITAELRDLATDAERHPRPSR